MSSGSKNGYHEGLQEITNISHRQYIIPDGKAGMTFLGFCCEKG